MELFGSCLLKELLAPHHTTVNVWMPSLLAPPTMLSVASAFPETSFSQAEIAALLGVANPVVMRLLQAPHIQKRHLLVPLAPTSSDVNDSLPGTPSRSHPDPKEGPSASPPMSPPGLLPLTPSSSACTVVSSPRAEQLESDDDMHLTSPTSAVPTTSHMLKHESRAELHARHLRGLSTIGVSAARRALTAASVTDLSLVTVVVAVSSTGLAMPGFSAILMEQLGLSPSTMRSDIVGMGCNAGMSGLRALCMMLSGISNFATKPVHGLLVCCEVCSAVYVNDDTTGSGIVNSLFGDGAVATVMTTGSAPAPVPAAVSACPTPLATIPQAGRLASASLPGIHSGWSGVSLTDFESCTLTEYFEDMKFAIPIEHDRMCFQLSKRIPYAVGDNVAVPVKALLGRHSLLPSDVSHWVVHSGGAAVIDGVQRNLGLPHDALRHTTSVLRDYGNISSGSFLVSLERLLLEHQSSVDQLSAPLLQHDQYIVFIAMGPGATIEVGLGRLV